MSGPCGFIYSFSLGLIAFTDACRRRKLGRDRPISISVSAYRHSPPIFHIVTIFWPICRYRPKLLKIKDKFTLTSSPRIEGDSSKFIFSKDVVEAAFDVEGYRMDIKEGHFSNPKACLIEKLSKIFITSHYFSIGSILVLRYIRLVRLLGIPWSRRHLQ
jgi:hypothetical protein